MVTTKTKMSRPGCWNASYVADARPLRKKTHQQMTPNAASSGVEGSATIL
jgi:hypothetical protein